MKLVAKFHLTQTQRKNIKAMIDAGLNEAKVNKMNLAIKDGVVFLLEKANWGLDENGNRITHKWVSIATIEA